MLLSLLVGLIPKGFGNVSDGSHVRGSTNIWMKLPKISYSRDGLDLPYRRISFHYGRKLPQRTVQVSGHFTNGFVKELHLLPYFFFLEKLEYHDFQTF